MGKKTRGAKGEQEQDLKEKERPRRGAEEWSSPSMAIQTSSGSHQSFRKFHSNSRGKTK